MSRQGGLEDERGFTLVELLLVIILMGIVLAIASSNWLDAIDSRKVDAATNQVVADLRFAHSQATNRLADSDFTTPDPTPPTGTVPLSTYEIGPTGAVASDSLPEGTKFGTATRIRFGANGSAQVVTGPPAAADGFISITVASTKDATNNNTVKINTVTSGIKVVP